MSDFPTTKSSAPSASMGGTKRMPWAKKSPGPGDYIPEAAPGMASAGSATAIRRGDAPCFSIRSRPSTAKTASAKALYKSTSAVTLSSLGYQVPSQNPAAPGWTMGKYQPKARPATPGPLDYKGAHRSTLSAAGAGMFGGNSFSSSDRFGGGEPKRLNNRPQSASAHITPGPGEHWPPLNNLLNNACCVMSESSLLPARPAFSFGGKHNKTQYIKEARPQSLGVDSPGPHKYDPVPLPEGAAYTMQARARGTVVNPPPAGDGSLCELTVLWRKPAPQPGPLDYKARSLYWDGRTALGRSVSAPRSLLDPRTKVARPPRASWR